MRGIRDWLAEEIKVNGITPAHAGNTSYIASYIASNRDHPRACGEYSVDTLFLQRIQGSPPRMRGIPGWHDSEDSEGGITPAHAGNTRPHNGGYVRDRDHPRACGEYNVVPDVAQFKWGSPPRMRGILSGAESYYMGNRITPAHAGNTTLPQDY